QVLKRRAVRGEITPSEVAELAEKIIDGLEPLVERLDEWVEFARSRTCDLEIASRGVRRGSPRGDRFSSPGHQDGPRKNAPRLRSPRPQRVGRDERPGPLGDDTCARVL